MQIKFIAYCQFKKRNNGIVKALFSSTPVYSDEASQEEGALVNFLAERGELQMGRPYFVTIEPAFPHED